MKNSCFIFFIFFLFGSCQRNDIETLNGPFFSYLNRNGVSIDTVANAAKFWEYGFQFKSLKLQTMNGVGIKVPAIGIFKVKLYDLILGKLLLDTVVNSFITNQETYININEIKLVENGVFGIAIVADVFFKVKNVNNAPHDFPHTSGNLEIISFNEDTCGINGCPIFPVTINKQIIAPCVNIQLINTD